MNTIIKIENGKIYTESNLCERKDVFESLQHVLPSSYTYDEKLRKIGYLLRKMAKDGFIIKASNGKQWNITTKGEQELS